MSCTSWVTTFWRSSGLSSAASASPDSRKARSWVASASLSRSAILDMSSDLMMAGWILATTSAIALSAVGLGTRRLATTGSGATGGGGEVAPAGRGVENRGWPGDGDSRQNGHGGRRRGRASWRTPGRLRRAGAGRCVAAEAGAGPKASRTDGTVLATSLERARSAGRVPPRRETSVPDRTGSGSGGHAPLGVRACPGPSP